MNNSKLVFLISGKLQSGKNKFAEFLKKHISKKNEKLTIHEDLFARGVKDGCKEDFAELIKFLNNNTNIKTTDDNWYENKTDLTRILLQIYGTEIFRNRVDVDWWVIKQKERILKSDKDVNIITDVRFPNEIDVLKHLLMDKPYKLISIRINRSKNNNTGIKNHASEIALDNYKNFDYIYNNDKSLKDLDSFANIISNNYVS